MRLLGLPGRRSRLGRRRRRRPSECSPLGYLPVGKRLPGLPASRDARGIRARAHRAQDRPRLSRLRRSTPTRRHARGRPAPAATSPSTRWPQDERRRADRSATAAGATSTPRCCATCRRPSPRTRCASCAWRASRRASPTSASRPRPMALMREMVEAGEVDALVPERVWQELSRGLMEGKPSRMFEVLRGCGALARVLPEVDRLCGVPQRADYHPEVDTGVHLMMVLDMAARLAAPPRRCASPASATTSARARRRPRCCRATSATRSAASRWCARCASGCASTNALPRAGRASSRASTATSTAAASSAPRRSCACSSAATRCAGRERFAEVLLACECDARGRLGLEDTPYPPRARLADALRRVIAVDATAVAEDGGGARPRRPGDRRGDPRCAREGARRPRLASARGRRRWRDRREALDARV